MHYLFFILLVSLSAYSQHAEQPQQESIEDLRSTTALFIISDMKSTKSYMLKRNAALDHFLLLTNGDDIEVIKKTDTRDARKLDQDFAARFLRIQYEYPVAPGNCQVVWRLNMRGENLDICTKDDKKSQEVSAFVDELKKRF